MKYFYSFARQTGLLLIVLFFATHLSLVAQTYTVTPVSGTFIPMVGGTSVPEITNGTSSTSNAINIGFNFNFGGNNYTQLKAGQRGSLLLIHVAEDLEGRSINPFRSDFVENIGTAKYQISGTEPSRVFTFEWLNFAWSLYSAQANISFQVKLYETTNQIEFIYRQQTSANIPVGGARNATIYLNPSQYFILSNSGTNPSLIIPSNYDELINSVESITTRPASGQIYRFNLVAIPEPTNSVTNFALTSINDSIHLSWTDATGTNLPTGYLILASTTNSFTTPVDGTVYPNNKTTSVNLSYGDVYYKSWLNLIPGQDYYYRIYSYSNRGSWIDYKTSGIIPQGMVKFIRPTPENHATDFTSFLSGSDLNLTWTDAVAPYIPNGYVIFASTTNSFPNPVDGTDITADNNLADGAGVVKVLNGVQAYNSWTNVNSATAYYFKIYPYSNNGTDITYKTDAAVPTTMLKPQPTNHVTVFSSNVNNGVFSNSWTDAVGSQLPDGYVIMASTNSTFADPIDGTEIIADNDLIDNNGIAIVPYGTQTYSNWINYSSNTYYFKIFPYTNSVLAINYLTTPTVPQSTYTFTFKPAPRNHATSFVATNNNGVALNWVDGSNNALSFDGTNDFVSCGNHNYTTFTAEAWICPNVVTADQAIISTLNEGGNTGSELHLGADGKPCLTIRNSSGWLDIKSPNAAVPNKWVHISATFDGTTAKLYENGTLVASGTASYIAGSSILVLGRRSSGLLFFNGKIDEVRVWNIVRTQAEIATYIYEVTIYSNLMAYYKCNQGVASGNNAGITTLTDVTGRGNNGNLNNFALTGSTSNWVESWFAPDGYVIMANTSNSFTDPVDGIMASSDNNLGDNSGLVYVAQGIKSYSSWINARGSSNYYFRIYPYSNTGGFIKYYTAVTVPSASLSFVKVAPPNHPTNLTANVTDQNIVLNWTDAKEIYPNSGNAIALDGTNDFVAVPTLGSSLSELTIETWLNFNTIDAEAAIFNTNSWSPNDIHYQIWNNSTIEFAICGSPNRFSQVPYTFNTNTWYHLALTFNAATRQIKTYVNGILVQTVTVTTGPSINLTAAQLGAWTTSRNFNGKFDEYRIWSVARTQAELQNNMYSTLTGSESSLLAYYKFNQGVASETNAGITTVTDASVNAKNGTLTNSALTGTTSNWVGSFIAPDGYLIKASKTSFAAITDPIDGTDVTQDSSLADGIGAVKVVQGAQTYSGWDYLESSTTYYFKVYPYTNSGASIKYNKVATVPQVQVTSPFLQYTKAAATSLTNMFWSSTALGDYNNDGFLDVVLTGMDNSCNYQTQLFKNNQNKTFTLQGISFTGVYNGSVAWGDYENDADIDLLLTGYTQSGTIITKVYKNNYPTNTFTEQSSILLTGVFNGSGNWGDYDKDGDLDILISGGSAINAMMEAQNPITKIYRNNRDGSFTEMTEITLPGICYGNTAWGDYNNDGYPDILMEGRLSDGILTGKYFTNNGGNSFTEQKLNFGGIDVTTSGGNALWADYNNDSYLDVMVNGYNPNWFLGWTRVSYQNVFIYNSNGNITNSGSLLFGDYNNGISGKASIGDYDNDGLVDIFIEGYNSSGFPESGFFHNDGNNNFSRNTSISVNTLSSGASSFADIDNDGDLDLINTGSTNYCSEAKTELYINNNTVAISTPSVPVNLEVTKANRKTTFKWNKCTSGNSNTMYAIRIGTSSGASNIVSAHAVNSNGSRLVPGIELLLRDTSYTLENLEPISYCWSVQAVNQNGKGSAFATEKTFTIDSAQANNLTAKRIDATTLKLKWNAGNGNGRILFISKETTSNANPIDGTTYRAIPQLVDGCKYSFGGKIWYCVFNGIADSVVVTGLTPGIAYTCHVMEYFTKSNSDKYKRSAAIADANLGIFYTSDATLIGTFSDGSTYSKWGDYNNDRYTDILVSGGTGNETYTKIYANNGNNSFTEITLILNKYCRGSADVNNDGLLDLILVKGSSDTTIIFKNNSDSTYTPIDTIYVNSISKYDFGDYNNDGNVDLIACGSGKTLIYQNDGHGNFSSIESLFLPGVFSGNAIWGDYNNDGLLDIFLSGFTTNYLNSQANEAMAAIYRNDGEGIFVSQNFDIVPLGSTEASWGDYDNDGDLDIVYSGDESIGGFFTFAYMYLYKNNYPQNSFTTLFVKDGQARTQTKQGGKWVDFNNDGYLDISLIGGESPGADNNYTGYYSSIYNNSGNDSFIEKFSLPELYYGATSDWADYDNDGDIDLLVSSNNNGTKIYSNNLYHNLIQNANVTPKVPGGLISAAKLDKVTLSWLPVAGDNTASNTMSYNVRFKNIDSTHWQAAPHTLETSNTRQILGIGNTQLNTFKLFQGLADGNYQWQVQSIDQGMLASKWSDTATFSIQNTFADFISDTVCWGDTTRFINKSWAALGIKSFKWTFEGNKISSQKDPKYVFTKSGIQLVKLEVTDNSNYTANFIDTVLVKHGAIANFIVSSQCDQNSASIINKSTLSDSTSVDYQWLWKFGDNTTSTSKNPVSHSYSNDGKFTVQLTASINGCEHSVSNQVTITNTPSTAFSVDGKNTFCTGDSVVFLLTEPFNAAYNYSWKLGETPKGNTNKLTVKTDPGNYKVVVTNKLDSTCHSTSAIIPVDIKLAPSSPAINHSNDTTFCEGLTIKLSTITPANTYMWLEDTDTKEYPSGTANNITVTESGIYRLRVANVYANNLTCSTTSTDKVTITKKPKPAVTTISRDADTTFCSGSSVVLDAGNQTGTYKWFKDGASFGTNTNKLTVIESGTYNLAIRNSSECVTYSSNSFKISVKSNPTIPVIAFNPNNTTFCDGGSLQLSTPSLADSYTWLMGGNNLYVNNDSITVNKSGTYKLTTVLHYDNNLKCYATSTDSVIVTRNSKPQPTTIDTVGNTTLCKGNSMTIKVPEQSGVDYNWFKNGMAFGKNSNVLPITESGTFNLVLKNTSGCENASTNSVSVTVNPSPKQPKIIAPPVTTICKGEALIFSTEAFPDENYQWFRNSLAINSATNDSLTITQSGEQYYVEARIGDCLLTSDTVKAVVNLLPSAVAIELSDTNKVFCAGNSLTLTATGNANTFNYQWLRADNTAIEGAATNKLVVSETNGYKVRVSNNTTNCYILSDTVNITVNPSPNVPTVNAIGELAFCEGLQTTLFTKATDVTYKWLKDNLELNQSNDSITISEKGKYSLQVTNSYNCSATSAITAIEVYPAPPKYPISKGKRQFCEGESVDLETNYSNSSSTYTLQWKTNDGSIEGATKNDYTATLSGNYWLEATNTNDCAVTSDTVEIIVDNMPEKPVIGEQNNNTVFCPGTELRLEVNNPSDTYEYQWQNSKDPIVGAEQPVFEGKLKKGNYSVLVTSGACEIESDVLELEEKPAPPKPEIYAVESGLWLLGCSNDSANGYQWYYNQLLIPGATKGNYIADQNLGDYYVEINDGGECWTMSDIINIPTGEITSGINGLLPNSINVYPNPSNSIFNINFGSLLRGNIDVLILDAMGKTLQTATYKNTDQFELDLTHAKQGIYFCKIEHGGKIVMKKLVKE